MKIEINTFDELIQFIANNKLTPKQLIILVEATLQIYICPEDLENITEKLKLFWNEYGNKSIKERPIFLCNPLNENREDNFNRMLKSESFKKKIDELEAMY
jgi:hypothetical protein